MAETDYTVEADIETAGMSVAVTLLWDQPGILWDAAELVWDGSDLQPATIWTVET